MKRFLCIASLLLCMVSWAYADPVPIGLRCSGIAYIERSDALDAAFSMLEKDNPLLSKYNDFTGANVIGGQAFDAEKYARKGRPLFTKNNTSIIQLMNDMLAGDYLINTGTGETMICVGSIMVSGFDKNSAPSLSDIEYYPIVLHQSGSEAQVSVIGIPDINIVDGYAVTDLGIEEWLGWTWVRT